MQVCADAHGRQSALESENFAVVVAGLTTAAHILLLARHTQCGATAAWLPATGDHALVRYGAPVSMPQQEQAVRRRIALHPPCGARASRTLCACSAAGCWRSCFVVALGALLAYTAGAMWRAIALASLRCVALVKPANLAVRRYGVAADLDFSHGPAGSTVRESDFLVLATLLSGYWRVVPQRTGIAVPALYYCLRCLPARNAISAYLGLGGAPTYRRPIPSQLSEPFNSVRVLLDCLAICCCRCHPKPRRRGNQSAALFLSRMVWGWALPLQWCMGATGVHRPVKFLPRLPRHRQFSE